jgi:hypothetical protein
VAENGPVYIYRGWARMGLLVSSLTWYFVPSPPPRPLAASAAAMCKRPSPRVSRLRARNMPQPEVAINIIALEPAQRLDGASQNLLACGRPSRGSIPPPACVAQPPGEFAASGARYRQNLSAACTWVSCFAMALVMTCRQVIARASRHTGRSPSSIERLYRTRPDIFKVYPQDIF